MYCRKCRRKKTNSIEQFEQDNFMYSFTPDTEDQYCEECDAKERALNCSRVIKADLHTKKAKIMTVTEFDNDKFFRLKDKVINYWKKFYTPKMDNEKYTFWKSKFYSFIDDLMIEKINAFDNRG